MADYPPEALAAVAREVASQRHTGPPVDSDRQFAAGILDVAAPLLAEAWGVTERGRQSEQLYAEHAQAMRELEEDGWEVPGA